MESSLVRKIDNRDIDIDISSIVPSRVDVENLELSDFIIMATISHDFDARLKYFFEMLLFQAIKTYIPISHRNICF